MSAIEWRPVRGHEGVYEVSNNGLVRRVGKQTGAVVGRILKPSPNRGGYLMVRLSAGNVAKTRLIHRLVAMAFIGEPASGHEVCHRDGNRQNNTLDNLRWDTHVANMNDRTLHGRNINMHSNKTHCIRGHEFSPENTITRVGKSVRGCRICKRATDKARLQIAGPPVLCPVCGETSSRANIARHNRRRHE
jgi:hypothetical protein